MYRGILFKNGVKVERVVTGRMVLVHLNRSNLSIIHCTSILLQIVELYRALSCSHTGSGMNAVVSVKLFPHAQAESQPATSCLCISVRCTTS